MERDVQWISDRILTKNVAIDNTSQRWWWMGWIKGRWITINMSIAVALTKIKIVDSRVVTCRTVYLQNSMRVYRTHRDPHLLHYNNHFWIIIKCLNLCWTQTSNKVLSSGWIHFLKKPVTNHLSIFQSQTNIESNEIAFSLEAIFGKFHLKHQI